MENFYKKYYGDNYDKAMENSRKEKLKMKANFIKKYPNADLTKFEFVVSMKRNGDIDSTAIYFKNSDILSTDITSDTFLNDKSMTKYLYSNKIKQTAQLLPTIRHKSETKFPSKWDSGGTIIDLPKGKKHKRMYPINGIDYYYDNFPTDIVLNYPVNNFRIYVNNNEYFNSNLPTLKIPTN